MTRRDMQIFAQGQAIHTVNVSQETTVEELKQILSEVRHIGDGRGHYVFCQVECIPSSEQVVSFGGVPLENDVIISEVVPELATLSVTGRVVGGLLIIASVMHDVVCIGKVHGSLARAGKVRGQTPKVCTAEHNTEVIYIVLAGNFKWKFQAIILDAPYKLILWIIPKLWPALKIPTTTIHPGTCVQNCASVSCPLMSVSQESDILSFCVYGNWAGSKPEDKMLTGNMCLI